GPLPVKHGYFNVPSGGVSNGGLLYAFFWTNHCMSPNGYEPNPLDPLARPLESKQCPETDDRNSIGRSVLARSDDLGKTFSGAVPMPTGFVYATAVDAAAIAGLPAEQRLGTYVFAVPRYRASVPYLAYAPPGTLENPSLWRFFVGRGPNGQPSWISRHAW